jgi:hypothetical protein
MTALGAPHFHDENKARGHLTTRSEKTVPLRPVSDEADGAAGHADGEPETK